MTNGLTECLRKTKRIVTISLGFFGTIKRDKKRIVTNSVLEEIFYGRRMHFLFCPSWANIL